MGPRVAHSVRGQKGLGSRSARVGWGSVRYTERNAAGGLHYTPVPSLAGAALLCVGNQRGRL